MYNSKPVFKVRNICGFQRILFILYMHTKHLKQNVNRGNNIHTHTHNYRGSG